MEFVKYVVEEFKDIVDVVELNIVVVLKEVVFMLVWLNVVEVSEVINIVVVEVVVVVDRHWSSQFNREQRDLLLHMVFEQSRQGQRTFLRQPSSTPTHLNRVSRHLFLDF